MRTLYLLSMLLIGSAQGMAAHRLHSCTVLVSWLISRQLISQLTIVYHPWDLATLLLLRRSG
jgi:hypothetical protein